VSDKPTRDTTAGTVYLDLRKLARHTGRPTDELLQLYALEGFLSRVTMSRHRPNFVLKGGVLLAAYEVRRPTRDIDFAMRNIDGDLGGLLALIKDVLSENVNDGISFDIEATTIDTIRDEAVYPGARARISGALATAKIRSHIDINIGDPLWPEPAIVEIPRLLGGQALPILGYSIELVLAEKIVTGDCQLNGGSGLA